MAKNHIVSGATNVTRFGFARIMRSATWTIQSTPPAEYITDEAVTTANKISMTSIGAEVGFIPKPTTRINKPRPPKIPSPIPLYRAPIATAPNTTTSCKIVSIIEITYLVKSVSEAGSSPPPNRALIVDFLRNKFFQTCFCFRNVFASFFRQLLVLIQKCLQMI